MKTALALAVVLIVSAAASGACGAGRAVAVQPTAGSSDKAVPAAEEPQVKLDETPQDSETRRKNAIERARQYLSKTTKINLDDISVESATEATWPDASLGCPEKDRMYAQVVTQGYKVILRARGTAHELHVGRGRIVECKAGKEG